MLQKNEKRALTTTKYLIPKDSMLETQLRYQLKEHKHKKMVNIALPDPTIDTLLGTKYLILTEV